MQNSNDAQTGEGNLCALVCAPEQNNSNNSNDLTTFVGPPASTLRSLISRLFMIDPKDITK